MGRSGERPPWICLLLVVRQLVDEFRQIVELEVHVENGDDIALRVANRLGERHDETVREAREEQVGPIGFARVDDVAEPFLLLEIDVEEGAEQPFVAALRMDLHEVFDGQQFVLTGNYPYDISSQIFFKMLDNKDLIPCCTGMIQHEVAVRMASQPGNKQYGILSVLIQAWYNVEYLFTVEPGVFNPPPKVQSAVIRMTRNEVTDLGCDEQLFKRVVKATFNQRRKMLRVSLRQIFDSNHPAPAGFFDADIMTRRPEQLSIPQFVELTNMVAAAL